MGLALRSEALAVVLLVTVAAGAAAADARLPEDPVQARQAEAQWRDHLAREERERRLAYDRRRAKQHQAVLSFVVKARQRYDRATTRRRIERLRAAFRERLPEVRRRVLAIDHWRVSSNVLGEYDALLTALADRYPAALAAALEGDDRPLAAARADLDRWMTTVRGWLAEADAAEDE